MAKDLSIARLVIRAPNWLGDAVLALPAMASVRAAFPSSELTIAAPASVAALFRERIDAAPDHVLEVPPGTAEAQATIQSGRFDAGILFPNSFRSAWILYRAGVRERWGYSTAGRGLLLTRRSRQRRAKGQHQSDYYRALVDGLGMPCADDTRPSLQPSDASAQRADGLLKQHRASTDRPLIALLPGAAYGEAKQWPSDRMAELAARLVTERGASCVIAGATNDRPAARAIESWLRDHAPEAVTGVVDLVGHTSLGALTGVLARAAVCVSNDSGGMHLASALGRPVVAIFGPTDERATRPTGEHDLITEPVFCRPCMLRDCPIDHRCMTRIGTDRVFAAVSARLDAAGAV